MTRNQFWTAMSKALTAMTVTLIVTLILATSAAAEYKILYQFKNAKYGANPSGSLTMDAAGNLYGTTISGGTGACSWTGNPGCGTVFMLKTQPDGTWKYNVLHSFTGGADGGNPDGGLILDKAGNLYGTTYNGGNCNRATGCGGGPQGTVFK